MHNLGKHKCLDESMRLCLGSRWLIILMSNIARRIQLGEHKRWKSYVRDMILRMCVVSEQALSDAIICVEDDKDC